MRATRTRRDGRPGASDARVGDRPSDAALKAAVLRRLELEVSRPLDGLLSGNQRTFAFGPGGERVGGRRYEPGDDARMIDWSLTARSFEPHVRTTEAERERETWCIVDRSASLDFGTAQREKRDVALAATAAFGLLTVGDGNRFSVLVAGTERLQRLPAAGSRAGVLATLAAVYDSPRMPSGPAAGADLNAALRRAQRTIRRRGQIIVISDFLESSEWAGQLRRLVLRHDVVAVSIVDPRELELPPVGLLSVVDKETGRHVEVPTGPALRARFAAAAAARDEQIRRAILATGAQHLRLRTDRDWLLDVMRFLTTRRRTSRLFQPATRWAAP
jgi:uncharacterized protein (DUF58 family)